MKFFNNVNIGEDICIDPGTDFTSIYIKGEGLVLREASVVAYNNTFGEIAAIGDEAACMEGRAPKSITTHHPIKNGVITDLELASELFSRLFAKVRKNNLIKPRVMLSLPCGLTDVEKKAAIDSIIKAGARQVIVIDAPIAAALGAGCDITLARGLMVLDIGAGKSEMAAISLCNTVTSRTIKLGGNDFTNDIIAHIKTKYNLLISSDSAKYIKGNFCKVDTQEEKSVSSKKSISHTTISGIDTTTHLPRHIKITPPDCLSLFESRFNTLSKLIRDTLACVPNEILGDILSDGILLVGGGAKINSFAKILSEKSGIKLFPAEDIELCNIKGAGIAIENLEALPGILKSYHNI